MIGLVVGILLVVLLTPQDVPAGSPQPVVAVAPTVPTTQARAASPVDVAVAPPASTASVIPPAASPARLRLEEIRSMVDPGLGRYERIRKLLGEFVLKHPGLPETEEARQLLAEVDDSYARRADAEFASTRTVAAALAARGEYDGAVSLLRSLERRFSDGEWLSTRGRKMIDDAVAATEASRPSLGKGLSLSVPDGATVAKTDVGDADLFSAAEGALIARIKTGRSGWTANLSRFLYGDVKPRHGPRVRVEFDVHDGGYGGSVRFVYDSSDLGFVTPYGTPPGTFKPAEFRLGGENRWSRVAITLKDARFEKGCNTHDFRFELPGTHEVVIGAMRIVPAD